VHAHKFSKTAQDKITKAAASLRSCSNARKALEHLPGSDLRKRVLFTLGLLAVYRIGATSDAWNQRRSVAQFFEQNKGSVLGFVDLFSGGNLRRLTISPSASCRTLRLHHSPVADRVYELSPNCKRRRDGPQEITMWTRYLTVILSAVQSFGIAISLQKAGDFVNTPGPSFILMTMLTLTTGSAFIMWLASRSPSAVSANGMSLLIFTGIVVGLPAASQTSIRRRTSAWESLPLRPSCSCWC